MSDSPAAILYDENGNPLTVVNQDGEYHLKVASPEDTDRRNIVGADIFHNAIAGPTDYFLAVDLSNEGGSGPYKHSTLSGGVKLTGYSGVLLKSKVQDQWDALVGVVLAIDGTQATVAYLQMGSLHLRSTNEFKDRVKFETFPVLLDLTVSSGEFSDLVVGFTETTTDLNTGVTIPNVEGTGVTPAVGDVIIKTDRVSGSGTATVHYSFWYFVE